MKYNLLDSHDLVRRLKRAIDGSISYRKLFIALVIFTCVSATLSPSSPKRKGKSQIKSKEPEYSQRVGTVGETVFDRGLVEEEPSSRTIIVESGAYYEDTSLRNFNGTVLGYVTPWNNHGYNVAKTFGPKFDMISPVWLQILRKGDMKYELTGTHDVDSAWMKNVRGHNENTKILPRVLFDKFESQDYTSLLSQKDERTVVAKLLVDACKKHGFDGIVLEVWQSLAKRVEDAFLYSLVKEIAAPLKSAGLALVLVVPPHRDHMQDLFSAENFNELYSSVTAFSLMTYDFSTLERPGANAPLHWVKSAVEHVCPKKSRRRQKILLGLNMYGYDYTPQGGGTIMSREYLEYLKLHQGSLILDDHDKENFFELKGSSDGGRHIIFYPTLYSINERVKLAQELGTGLSVWELGQGLDYFYDLL